MYDTFPDDTPQTTCIFKRREERTGKTKLTQTVRIGAGNNGYVLLARKSQRFIIEHTPKGTGVKDLDRIHLRQDTQQVVTLPAVAVPIERMRHGNESSLRFQALDGLLC